MIIFLSVLAVYIFLSLYFSVTKMKDRMMNGVFYKALPFKKAFLEGFLVIPMLIIAGIGFTGVLALSGAACFGILLGFVWVFKICVS